MAWSPKNNFKPASAASGRNSKGPRRVLSTWSAVIPRMVRPSCLMMGLNAASLTRESFEKAREISIAESTGTIVSACRNRTRSPRAARAPAFICFARQAILVSTSRHSAPPRVASRLDLRNARLVPSMDPPSTTTTSSRPSIDPRNRRQAGRALSSFNTGTTTERVSLLAARLGRSRARVAVDRARVPRPTAPAAARPLRVHPSLPTTIAQAVCVLPQRFCTLSPDIRDRSSNV
mmetsp:Transcript_10111/g.30844  ORF Transcript_10111/g.30844 Transcript_10111/m.30844 type:complete len:234 (-) Transcript_10111:12-713(-)